MQVHNHPSAGAQLRSVSPILTRSTRIVGFFALCIVGVACGGSGGSDSEELDDAGRRNRDATVDDPDNNQDNLDAGDGGRRDGGVDASTDATTDAARDRDGNVVVADSGKDAGAAPDTGIPAAITNTGSISASGGTITLTDSDGSASTTLKVPANAVKEETPVTIATATLPSTAPATVEQITPGFSIDLNGKTLSVAAKARLRLPLMPASGELIILATTDLGTTQVKYTLESEGGVTYASFDVKDGGRYLAVRLVPASGCTRTLAATTVVTTQAAVDALSDVKRIAGGLSINGANITSLAGLKCLQQVDNLGVQNAGLESLAGLEQLTFTSGISLNYNARLTQVELPSLLSAGTLIDVEDNPLLTSLKLPLIESAGMTFSRNGAAATATSLGLPALRRAASLTIGINPALQNLDGLGALEVAGNVNISGNIGLKQVDGLAQLSRVGDLLITSNAALTSAAGLGKLSKLTGLTFTSNSLVRSLELPELAQLGVVKPAPAPAPGGPVLPASVTYGDVEIDGNTGLTSFVAPKITGLGNFTFTANGNSTENTTLNLAALTQVTGSVIIGRNPGMQGLGGLGALKTAGSLALQQNAALAGTSGLGALESVAGGVNISNNAKLTEVSGFDALGGIGGSLTVTQNALLNGAAFPKLATLGSSLSVDSNAALTSFAAPLLRLLPEAFEFTGNGKAATPTSLSLPALTTVTTALTISNNPGLTQLDGLSALASVGGAVSIQSNATLAQINGLATLSNVTGALSILSNALLANLSGLSGLTRVSQGLTINTNATLSNITLPKLTTVGGGLSVSSNAMLGILRADVLTSVGAALSISSNGAAATAPAQTALSFALLEMVPALTVSSNPKLETLLASFPKLRGVTGALGITNNVLLNTCEATNLRLQIQTNGSLGSSSISGNLASGCVP
jgi:hypothetical protein